MEDFIIGLNIPKELIVIILSAVPIIELRIAIPAAVGLLDFSWYYALLLAVIGNMLPVPFILLFLETATRFLNRVLVFKRFLDWLFERTKRRGGQIQKYKNIGLILFVAIPLPMTGAWTGAIAAVILGICFKQAFFSILAGVIIAGIIVTCLTLLGWIGAVIAGVILFGIVIYSFLKARNNKRENSCNSS